MRYFKIVAFSILVLIVSSVFAGSVFAQITFQITRPPLKYHVFLAADLGLGTTNKGNKDFRINFGAGPTGTQQITVLVEDVLTGTQIVGGSTDPQPYTDIQGSYFIGELDEEFGGDFEIFETGSSIYNTVLATGRVPRGQYRITVGLIPDGAINTLNIDVAPPYLQPLYPVDMQTNKASLDFRWVTNIGDMELRFFTDPSGNKEVLKGSRAPFVFIPGGGDPFSQQAFRVNGSEVSPVLVDKTKYYWRVDGKIKTSHGDEEVEGVLTAFQYFVVKEDVAYIGLNDADKQKILNLLITMLQQVVGDERAAKSLTPLEVDRIVKDNSPVTTDELISILTQIISGEVTITSIQMQ